MNSDQICHYATFAATARPRGVEKLKEVSKRSNDLALAAPSLEWLPDRAKLSCVDSRAEAACAASKRSVRIRPSASKGKAAAMTSRLLA